MIRLLLILALAGSPFTSLHTLTPTATIAIAQKPAAFDVRKYGAKGEGKKSLYTKIYKMISGFTR